MAVGGAWAPDQTLDPKTLNSKPGQSPAEVVHVVLAVSGEASVGVCNAAGLGEEAEVAVKVGLQSSTEGRLSVSRGRLGGRPYEGDASIAQSTHSYEPTSSFVERQRGATINVGRSAPDLCANP